MADKIEPYRRSLRPRSLDELFDDMQRSFEDMVGPFFTETTWPYLDTQRSELGRLPHADIEETDTGYTVTAEMPGITKENIEVKLSDDNTVEISGKSSSEKKETKGKYIRQERSRTDFYRRFMLEHEVDADKVEAKVENGILTLTLPKKTTEAAKVKKVQVR